MHSSENRDELSRKPKFLRKWWEHEDCDDFWKIKPLEQKYMTTQQARSILAKAEITK